MSGALARVGDVTLFVHRGTDTRVLADGLAALLAQPLPDPFAEEVVAVPAKGVERWLAQRLSHRLGTAPGGQDGVCAGVRFLNPHSLVALVLGVERDDPWHADRLAWPVLQVVDDSLDEPWARTLARHLGRDHAGAEAALRRGRRYAVARRLAGLFASYAQQRPAMVADWRAGGSGDGLGAELDPDLAWQPELWRRVLDLVPDPPPDVRHAEVLARLRDGDDGLDLPGRLSLFGHTRIARSELEVLDALGQRRDVHLWLPQASPVAWDRLEAEVAAGPVPREEDRSGRRVAHPLLASLGRDARELQRSLALTGAVQQPVAGQDDGGPVPGEGPPGDGGRQDDRPPAPSLLRLLQDDIRADRVPTAEVTATRTVPAGDRSVQVHACHGAARQVEVLREVLTGLLQDDPTLEPRDILVMCPDIDAYAPLVHAGFGLGQAVTGQDGPQHRSGQGHAGGGTSRGGEGDPAGRGHPAHALRVRLADRAPRHTNPLLEVADRLVVLAGGRLTVSEVLDLVHLPVVRRRFGLDEAGLDRVADWVGQSVIRWGLDADHRRDYGLGAFPQNTWRSGLDRLLVGAALDGRDTDRIGTVLAVDDVDSGDVELAGRLAELVERLGATLRGLRECTTAPEWTRALREGVLGLADVATRDGWQLTQLERELSRIEAAAARDGGATALAPSDVHALLEEHLAGRATRSSFRTGTLTVCTMVPMRSVPHRVVCLVGLDDGVFPRSSVPDGDDALARRPVTGERDPRTEDRQLLLDAIMAARETVVVTYTGADEHTGAERPPAVPLQEVLDAVTATASGPGVDRVHVRHPLQPHDPRNLGAPDTGEPPLLPDGGAFSFDPTALAGAEAARGPRTRTGPLGGRPLPPPPPADLDLGSLQRFLRNPAGAYLRTRLGIVLPEQPEERHEGIPLDLDGLARWAVGDRILRSVLQGRDIGACCDAEAFRGELPPGRLGERVLQEVADTVCELAVTAWETIGSGAPGTPADTGPLDVDLDLGGGRRLTGTVPQVFGEHQQQSIEVTYSKVRAAQQLRSWVTALALAATGREGAVSHVVGRPERSSRTVEHLWHGPVPPDEARPLLAELVDLHDRGMCEPVPLPSGTAFTFARSYLSSGQERDALASARRVWEGGFGGPGEADDAAQRRVHGGTAPFEVLLDTPRDDERWHDGIGTRLGQYALRVWRPVLTGPGGRRLR